MTRWEEGACTQGTGVKGSEALGGLLLARGTRRPVAGRGGGAAGRER